VSRAGLHAGWQSPEAQGTSPPIVSSS
jgi:hypothetical protein